MPTLRYVVETVTYPEAVPNKKRCEAMRVYKFLSSKYGLEALKKRRLKVARISELNDPFEFLGTDLSDRNLRWAFTEVKSTLNEGCGLVCFSKRWTNPLLWSHYAESHHGLCLGFDIPDNWLSNVEYTRKRSEAHVFLSDDRAAKEREMKRLLCRKFSHWRYENEARLFVALNEMENDHYFLDFSDSLVLREVLVGAVSSISRHDVEGALGKAHSHVERVKTRAAVKTFNVVKNRDRSMW